MRYELIAETILKRTADKEFFESGQVFITVSSVKPSDQDQANGLSKANGQYKFIKMM